MGRASLIADRLLMLSTGGGQQSPRQLPVQLQATLDLHIISWSLNLPYVYFESVYCIFMSVVLNIVYSLCIFVVRDRR